MIESNFNKSALQINEFTGPFKVQKEHAENEIRKKTRINRIMVLSGLALTIGSVALGVIFLTFTAPVLPVALAFTAACLFLPLSIALTFKTKKLEKVIANQNYIMLMQNICEEYKKIRSENFSYKSAESLSRKIIGFERCSISFPGSLEQYPTSLYGFWAPDRCKRLRKEILTVNSNLAEWKNACLEMTFETSIQEKFKLSVDKTMAEMVKYAEDLKKENQISLDSHCPRTGTIFMMKKIESFKSCFR